MPTKRTLREAPSRETQMVSPSTTFVTAQVAADALGGAARRAVVASGFGVAAAAVAVAVAGATLVEVTATSGRVATAVPEPCAAFAPMAANPRRAAIVTRPLVLRLRIVLPVPPAAGSP